MTTARLKEGFLTAHKYDRKMRWGGGGKYREKRKNDPTLSTKLVFSNFLKLDILGWGCDSKYRRM
jgi:hypothetical protein